jgi:hypothetical protein
LPVTAPLPPDVILAKSWLDLALFRHSSADFQ